MTLPEWAQAANIVETLFLLSFYGVVLLWMRWHKITMPPYFAFEDYDAEAAWWWSLPRARCASCSQLVICDEQENPIPHGCGRRPDPPTEAQILEWTT